ncbi:hypothetical protein E2562_027282 [Oryza meyeriana var. granulata]|uniref:Uncharacterized protein n=1 Tax=Oryza meyeriana var. granulata TaxID=110450 RepID=A0A6G1C9R6_9ORYZ|nr:hypothetical protein E2562_027282 [Oryza meyeriana var. granulata]
MVDQHDGSRVALATMLRLVWQSKDGGEDGGASGPQRERRGGKVDLSAVHSADQRWHMPRTEGRSSDRRAICCDSKCDAPNLASH